MVQPVEGALLDPRAALGDQPRPAPEQLDQSGDRLESARDEGRSQYGRVVAVEEGGVLAGWTVDDHPADVYPQSPRHLADSADTLRGVSQASRQLSRLLRHTAGERGLAMTPDGWALIEDVCELLRMDRTALAAAVEQNDKSRLQVEGDRIRACQGHSAAGMPVTREALENSWRRVIRTDLLWHGTNTAALEAITREGLRPGRRTHVHLAPARNSHVGRRSAVDVMLGIDPAKLGQPVFEAPNGVLLVRSVPSEAIRLIQRADAVH